MGDATASYWRYYKDSPYKSLAITADGWYYWSGYDAYIGPFETKEECQLAYANKTYPKNTNYAKPESEFYRTLSEKIRNLKSIWK